MEEELILLFGVVAKLGRAVVEREHHRLQQRHHVVQLEILLGHVSESLMHAGLYSHSPERLLGLVNKVDQLLIDGDKAGWDDAVLSRALTRTGEFIKMLDGLDHHTAEGLAESLEKIRAAHQQRRKVSITWLDFGFDGAVSDTLLLVSDMTKYARAVQGTRAAHVREVYALLELMAELCHALYHAFRYNLPSDMLLRLVLVIEEHRTAIHEGELDRRTIDTVLGDLQQMIGLLDRANHHTAETLAARLQSLRARLLLQTDRRPVGRWQS